MAWEDWFLRLDPYNFETKEQQEEFFKPTETAERQKRRREPLALVNKGR